MEAARRRLINSIIEIPPAKPPAAAAPDDAPTSATGGAAEAAFDAEVARALAAGALDDAEVDALTDALAACTSEAEREEEAERMARFVRLKLMTHATPKPPPARPAPPPPEIVHAELTPHQKMIDSLGTMSIAELKELAKELGADWLLSEPVAYDRASLRRLLTELIDEMEEERLRQVRGWRGRLRQQRGM